MCTQQPFIKVETDVGNVHVHGDYGVVNISTSCLVIMYLSPRGIARKNRNKLD